MSPPGAARDRDPRAVRATALAAAANALDAELVGAPVDEQFILVLRACASGGHHALRTLCDRIADPVQELDEAPALALLDAVVDEQPALAATRAATWMMVAQRVAETWPGTWFDVLTVAREALPLPPFNWEQVRQLAGLTAGALMTEDPGDREGMHFQFSRESLENVIDAATGRRPERRDMLFVIPHWTASFAAGIAACDAHLGGRERPSPEARPR